MPRMELPSAKIISNAWMPTTLMVRVAATASRLSQDDRHCVNALSARAPAGQGGTARATIRLPRERSLRQTKEMLPARKRPENPRHRESENAESQPGDGREQYDRRRRMHQNFPSETVRSSRAAQTETPPTGASNGASTSIEPSSAETDRAPPDSPARGPRLRGGKVLVDGFSALFRHQIDATALASHLGDRTVGVGEIAKVPGIGRACPDASRLAVLFREVLVVDPVHAQGAFLHDASCRIEFARAVRASPRAQSATDAVILVHGARCRLRCACSSHQSDRR